MTSGFLKDLKSFFLENKNTKQTLVKNTFWLTFSSIISKVVKYFLIIYAARILRVEEYGTFNFALAFVALFNIFADLGISTLISRETAKEKEVGLSIAPAFTLKLILTFIALVLIILSSFLVPQTDQIKLVIFLVAGFTLLNGLSNFLYNCFYGRQEMQYQTLTEIIEALVTTILGIYLISLISRAYLLGIAYFIGGISGFVTIFIIFRRRFDSVLQFKIDFPEWKKIINWSWALALTGIFAAIYTNTDSIMLGFWRLFDQIGYYNAAQKIISLAIMPAGWIITAFLPTLTKASLSDRDRTQKIFDYQTILLFLIAVPIVIGGYILTNGLITRIYGINYRPAILAFRILIIMVITVYFSLSLSNILFVYNQQKKAFWVSLGSALLNIPLNALLIPRYGFYGAAIATVVTAFTTLFFLIYLTQRFTPIRIFSRALIKYTLIVLLAAILMGIILLFGNRYTVNVFLKITIGTIVYIATLIGYLLLNRNKIISV